MSLLFRAHGLLIGTKEVFNKYLKQLAKQDPPCPLCHRPFDNETEVEELVDEVGVYFNTSECRNILGNVN